MQHREIIELWPKYGDLAEATGENYDTVAQWANRNSIPSKHWPKIIKAAQEADIALTYKILAEANHD